MKPNIEALDGVTADPRAPQDAITGFAGNVSAVSVGKCSTAPQTLSSRKVHVVDLLFRLFELEPARAIAWAHVVQKRWPGFKGA